MTSTRIDAVCWDWNGTLLDDVDICLQVMNDVLAEYKRPALIDTRAYRSMFRFPIRDFYRDVGLGGDRFEDAVTSYLARLALRVGDARLQPGVRETLDAVRALGVRQVLASATLPDLLALQMAPHAVTDAFEEVLAIDDPYRASKRNVIAAWLERSGLPAANVLLVGDTNHDREIADEFGAPFLHFDAGHQEHAGSGESIRALEQLVPILMRGRFGTNPGRATETGRRAGRTEQASSVA